MRCAVVVTGVGECMNRLRSPGPALVCPSMPPLHCTLTTFPRVHLHNLFSMYCMMPQCVQYTVPAHCGLWTLHESVSLPTRVLVSQCRSVPSTLLLLHSSHSEQEWCPPSQGQSGRRWTDTDKNHPQNRPRFPQTNHMSTFHTHTHCYLT